MTKIYIIESNRRKGGCRILGIFNARELAIQALSSYVQRNYGIDNPADYRDDFDSNILEGRFYSEEESVEMFEREMNKKPWHLAWDIIWF